MISCCYPLPMHRTLVQLDETLYQQLRTRAFEMGCSLSALVRDLLAKAMGQKAKKKKLQIDQFKFIGCGRSKGKDVSVEHDKYLAEDILK